MSEQDTFCIEGSVQAGTFRVEQAVAEGGFAVVYRAYHLAFRAPVALKCLKIPPTLSRADQATFLEQFRAEAELLFRLSARIPAVVRPLHAGTLEGASADFVPYLAMEWLEGSTLEELLQRRMDEGRGPFPLDELTRLLIPAAEGLHQAHSFPTPNGKISVLHRDLKPANVFVASVDGVRTTKLLDFGIAKVKSAATAIVGKVSVQQGTLAAFTPCYAAPEQWAPHRYGQTGPWTDVWGLAITMVEAALGRAPVDGDHAAMLGAVLDPEVRPTPRTHGLDVPEAVEAVFRKALAVDPRERYLAIADYYADLRRALRASAATAVVRPSASAAGRSSGEGGTSGDGGVTASGNGGAPALAYARTQQRAAPAAPALPALVPSLELPAPAVPHPVAPRPPEPGGDPAGRPAARAGAKPTSTLAEVANFTRLVVPDPIAADPASAGLGPPGNGAAGPATASPAAARAPQTTTRGAKVDAGPAARAPRDRFRRDLDQLAQQTRDAELRARHEREAVGSLRQRLLLPSQLVLAGILIAALAIAVERFAGGTVQLPFRPLWVAGPLVLLGIVLGAVRLFLSDDD
jgi:hypothetical protein